MAKELGEVLGTATVKDLTTGTEKMTQEKLGLTLKEGPTAEVGCEVSFTKNLGNYQSARMQVSLRAPSNLDDASLDKTFEYVHSWCDTKLAKMIKEAEEALG